MIVAVAGQKGGTGKSTIAVCLADEAACRGRQVLLVDADPQGTARTWGEVATESAQTSRRPDVYAEPTIVAMGETMHRPDQLPRLAAGFADVIIDLHQGWSLHAGVTIAAGDDEGRERLCRYVVRHALSMERMSWTKDGRIAYAVK